MERIGYFFGEDVRCGDEVAIRDDERLYRRRDGERRFMVARRDYRAMSTIAFPVADDPLSAAPSFCRCPECGREMRCSSADEPAAVCGMCRYKAEHGAPPGPPDPPYVPHRPKEFA
jgi:uncharacterized protein with PIN domain